LVEGTLVNVVDVEVGAVVVGTATVVGTVVGGGVVAVV
jgi:hypothetical protein